MNVSRQRGQGQKGLYHLWEKVLLWKKIKEKKGDCKEFRVLEFHGPNRIEEWKKESRAW